MIPKRKKVLALYGNVVIPRIYCQRCDCMALIVENRFTCCDRLCSIETAIVKRMISPVYARKTPKKTAQNKILEEQDFKCIYCEKRFGSYCVYHGKVKAVKITWDHFDPFCFSQNNHDQNFVAACQFCNAWKHAGIFKTIEEIKLYVKDKWEKESTDNQVLPLREGISSN